MKKNADRNRRPVEFQVGDKVLVKLPDQRQSKYLRRRDPRLLQKYIGPVSILKRIGNVAYKVDVPRWWKVHPVFHVSLLKPYHEDMEDPVRGQDHRTALGNKTTGKQVAEAILDDRINRHSRKGHQEYLVRWQGHGDEENTWEKATDLKAFQPLITEYLNKKATRALPKQAGENFTGRASTLLCDRTISQEANTPPANTPAGPAAHQPARPQDRPQARPRAQCNGPASPTWQTPPRASRSTFMDN